MAWPLSQDFNEAIQNPSSAFRDADLKGGRVSTTPIGVPLPRSGNYADVYQVTGADGRAWAVKCFTRAVAPDLQARYAAIAGHLAQANLPFTVGFEFLADGIRVKGQSYPVLKMQWVEGLALNTFVKENLNRATILENMLSLWVRLCRRLRETGMAHCDLQHGNVILVPGEKQNMLGLKLVDYDGIFVPALTGKNPGEAGHASFQHPERVSQNVYSADLDRFPHLVVATALRGLLVGGKPLWDQYDTGDNLLFTSKDFANPAQSKVMRKLWDTGDPFTVGLLSHLVISCTKPLATTPWLDALMPEGRPPVLTPSQERQAMQILGIATAAAPAPSAAKPVSGWTAPTAEPELGFDASSSSRPREYGRKSNSTALYGAVAAGVLAAVGIGVGIVAFGGKKSSTGEFAQASAAPEAKPPEPDKQPDEVKKPDEVRKPDAVKKPDEVKQPDEVKKPDAPTTTGLKTGKVRWNVPAGSVARAASFSLDGSHILYSTPGTGEVEVRDAKTGAVVTKYTEHGKYPLAHAAALPSGKVLSIASEDHFLVWDGSTGKGLSKTRPLGLSGPILLLQTDQNGGVALIGQAQKVTVFDLESGKELARHVSPPDVHRQGTVLGRCSAMLSPDGSKMLALTTDNKLKTYSLTGGTPTEVPLSFPHGGLILAWNAAKNLAVIPTGTGEKASARLVVDVLTGQTLHTLPGGAGRAALTPDGEFVVLVAAKSAGLNYYDARTGVLRGTVPLPAGVQPTELAISAESSTALLLTKTNDILLLESPFANGSPRMPDIVKNPMPMTKPQPMPMTVETPKTRKPLPAENVLKSVEVSVKDALKEKFAKTSNADRQKLIDELLRIAADMNTDAPTRYWVLREASRIAVEVTDIPRGLKASELIEAEYEVDGLSLKLAFLDKIGERNTAPTVVRKLFETCSDLVEELAEKDDFDGALKAAAVGIAALAKANMQSLGKELEARVPQLKKQKQAFEPVKAALDKLKNNTDDAAANLAVGRYRCFVLGRWSEGLPHLAKGSDGALKTAAVLDLNTDENTLKKAEAWVAWAETATDTEKTMAQNRAKSHYFRCLTASDSAPIDKLKAEKALVFRLGSTDYAPYLVEEVAPVNAPKTVRKLIKPVISTNVSGSDFRQLPTDAVTVKLVGFIVPPAPGRYRFTGEGHCQASVKIGSPPDQKQVVDIKYNQTGNSKFEETVVLPLKPTFISIEVSVFCSGPNSRPENKFALKWTRPGSKTAETIPTEALFHNKDMDRTFTKE